MIHVPGKPNGMMIRPRNSTAARMSEKVYVVAPALCEDLSDLAEEGEAAEPSQPEAAPAEAAAEATGAAGFGGGANWNGAAVTRTSPRAGS